MSAAGHRGWAVVTGASSGIGAALADRLAQQGHDLILVARREDRLIAFATRAKDAHGVEVDIRPVDLADPVARAELCAEVSAREIAVLCANAGFSSCGPLRDGDPARLAREVQVNVVALHELTCAVLPGMLDRGRGGVLLTGSAAGEQPVPTAATYAATKAFVNSFAQAVHEELRGTPVTCTLLAPGPVRTELYEVGGIPDVASRRWLRWLNADRVAEAGLTGMARRRRVVVPGTIAKAQALCGRYLPRWVLFPFLRTILLPALWPPRRAHRPATSPVKKWT